VGASKKIRIDSVIYLSQLVSIFKKDRNSIRLFLSENGIEPIGQYKKANLYHISVVGFLFEKWEKHFVHYKPYYITQEIIIAQSRINIIKNDKIK
jgi:hypothetical protein